MWYSIDIGPVHLVSYDSEVYNMADKKYVNLQLDWLTEDLKKANQNRGHTPWIVVIGHKPLYCTTIYEHDCNQEVFDLRTGLEEVFCEQSVDLLLGGHEHGYERMWPACKSEATSNNYTNPSSPVTVISGAAGSGYKLDSLTGPPSPLSAFRMTNQTGVYYSYGILTVKNSTHIYWEQKSATSDHVIDSFWLVQTKHGSYSDGSDRWIGNYIEHVKDVIKSNKGIAIGLATAFGAFLLLCCVCLFMRCRRRRGVTRRWEVVDYDKSFYSDVRTEDDDFAFDDPEPSMESNGTKATTKLLGKVS